MSFVPERVVKLSQKFENPTVYKKWVDATFPVLGDFLRLQAFSLNGRIVVVNEASTPLLKIEPHDGVETMKELKLVRSDDYRFRREPSSTFASGPGWMTLFQCLVALLNETGQSNNFDILLGQFDRFTTSESHCPGLGEIVKEILGEQMAVSAALVGPVERGPSNP
jgi:hypothetical protein